MSDKYKVLIIAIIWVSVALCIYFDPSAGVWALIPGYYLSKWTILGEEE